VQGNARFDAIDGADAVIFNDALITATFDRRDLRRVSIPRGSTENPRFSRVF
jgi:hypothetical protein